MPNNGIVDLRKERERREREKRANLSSSKPQRNEVAAIQKKEVVATEKLVQDGDGFFWEAPEFEYQEKQQGAWIRNALIIAIPIIILFVLTKNVLGVVLVLLGAAAFLLSAFRKPSTVKYGIDDRGVVVGSSIIPYGKLESFWIFPEGQGNMLSLRRIGVLSQHLTLPLGDVDRDDVYNALIPHIEEIEQRPSITDAWLRRIGY